MSAGVEVKPTSLAQVYWRCGGQRLLWIIAVSVCILGAAFAFTGGQADELAAGSLQTTATITEANNYDGVGNSTDLDDDVRKSDISFQFKTEDGQLIKGTKHLPNIERDRKIGETFPVWYAEASPENYELAVGHKERNSSAVRWIAGLFTALATVVATWLPLSEARQLLSVRDSGAKRSALVVEPTRNQINHHDLGDHLHWEYEGLKPDHSRFAIPEADRPAAGETITIYQGRSNAVWEGEFGPAPS